MSPMRKKSRRLVLPFALVVVAAGLAFQTSESAQAQEGTAAHREAPTAERASESSGARNVYTQESIDAVPAGPDAGRQLYVQACSTCHGVTGEGTEIAPPLIGAGAAKADFYMSTGRMPAEGPTKQAPRREPIFTEEQRHEIAEYVATFGEGPPIPEVDPERGDLVEGNLLYSTNCAACHNATGSGGAVGREYYAPELYPATPLEIAEAIRSGPGAMPIFNHGALTDDEVNSIVRYIEHLKGRENPGGFSIGALGPFSEGFVAWIVGLGAMVGLARWIGSRD